MFDKLNSFHNQLLEEKNQKTSVDRFLENTKVDGIFKNIKDYEEKNTNLNEIDNPFKKNQTVVEMSK